MKRLSASTPPFNSNPTRLAVTALEVRRPRYGAVRPVCRPGIDDVADLQGARQGNSATSFGVLVVLYEFAAGVFRAPAATGTNWRARGGAEVAQQLYARAQNKGDRPKRLRGFRPDGAAIGLYPAASAAGTARHAPPRGSCRRRSSCRRSKCRGRRYIWSRNRRSPPRRARTGASNSGEAVLSMMSGTPRLSADVGDFPDLEDNAVSDFAGFPRRRPSSWRRSRGGNFRDPRDRQSAPRRRTASASERTA